MDDHCNFTGASNKEILLFLAKVKMKKNSFLTEEV